MSETAISQSQDWDLITEDHKQKTTMLTKHLAHLEKEETVEVIRPAPKEGGGPSWGLTFAQCPQHKRMQGFLSYRQ